MKSQKLKLKIKSFQKFNFEFCILNFELEQNDWYGKSIKHSKI